MASIHRQDLIQVFKKHKGHIQDAISEKVADINNSGDLTKLNKTMDLQNLVSDTDGLLSQLHIVEVIAMDLFGRNWDEEG